MPNNLQKPNSTLGLPVTRADGRQDTIPVVALVDQAGNAYGGTSSAGTDMSGTVTTVSGAYSIPANANRRPGDVQGQNVGSNTIGFNEFGAPAAIGSAGTYTVPPNATFSIATNRTVNFIASGGNSAVTVTGLA